MHPIPDVLALIGDQFPLLPFDVVLLFAVVRDDKLVDVLDELAHHASLQAFEPVRQKVVARLDVFITVELYGSSKARHALVHIVGDGLARLRQREQDYNHVL